MLCRFLTHLLLAILAVPCASHSKRAVYYSMMCLPIQWSRKACKVTDSNDVTCVPTNDSPLGEASETVGELFSGTGHSRSARKQSEISRSLFFLYEDRRIEYALQRVDAISLEETSTAAAYISERKLLFPLFPVVGHS